MSQAQSAAPMSLWRMMRLSWALLNSEEQRRVTRLGAGMVGASVLEAFGVAMVMPFMTLVLPPMSRAAGRSGNWWARLWMNEGSTGSVWWVGLLTVGAIVGAALWSLWARQALLRFCYHRYHSLSDRLFKRLLGQDYAFFLQRNSSQLIKVVVADCEAVVNKVLLGWTMLLANAVLALAIAMAVWVVQPAVALAVSLVLGGLYVLIYQRLRRQVQHIGQQRQRAGETHARIVQEALVGIRDVKAFSAEQQFIERQSAQAAIKAETTAEAVVLAEQPRKVVEVIAIGSALMLMLAVAVQRGEASGVLPLAALYVFAAYRLLPCAQQVYQQLVQVRFYAPTVERIQAYLAAPLAHDAAAATGGQPSVPVVATQRLRHGLSLQHVSYRYPGDARTPTLVDVSIHIRAGQAVALVGGTGAGKSTVVALLLGLLQPDQGQVLADGQPILAGGVQAWRKRLGYVGQQIYLIDETIAANIALGHAQIDRARVEQAARLAQLHDMVTARLPEGYDTRVGDNGVRLSGGERQRLGLARALYGDPDILLLDEATSAIDGATEQAVMQAIWALRGSKTIVIVAHRLHTVQGCDAIHLMRHGRVVASGSFDALLGASTEFEGMVQAQLIDDPREAGA